MSKTKIKPISQELLVCALRGVKHLSKDALESITMFLESQLTEEGVFCDRFGDSDLYYTMFGLLCGIITGEIKFNYKKINHYLLQIKPDTLGLVHLSVYIRIKLLLKLSKRSGVVNNKLVLETIRLNKIYTEKSAQKLLLKLYETKDHSMFPSMDRHSPYSLFLYLGASQDCGLSYDKNRITGKLSEYKSQKGAFNNIKNSNLESLNASVAAVLIKRQLNEPVEKKVLEFIKNMQHRSGGFFAEKKSDMPDMLSTATGLFALNCFEVKPKYDSVEFIKTNWLNNGGWTGTVLDSQADCEYTFYGLLALGALLV